MQLRGQVALITGGASGLGRATAELFKARGAVVAIADRNEKLVRSTSEELGIIGHACDVCDTDSIKSMLDTIGGSIGSPRILINCAGVTSAQRILGREGLLPIEEFARVVNVNLVGTFNMLRLAAERMAALDPLDTTERGVIINTSSVAAFEGQLGQASYAASKGGVAALTLPSARELAKYGIRVLAIAPGIFATPLLLELPEKAQKSLAELMPFPKRLGAPQEFGALAAHLVENVMLNGEVIRLDGAVRLQ